MALAGNSIFIACINMVFSALVVPRAARRLARIKYAVKGTMDIHSPYIIKYFKQQAATALILEVVSVLIAPMLATLSFDEACLRYYLE